MCLYSFPTWEKLTFSCCSRRIQIYNTSVVRPVALDFHPMRRLNDECARGYQRYCRNRRLVGCGCFLHLQSCLRLFVVDMSIKLSCERKRELEVEGRDYLAVIATIKKGERGGVELHDAQVRLQSSLAIITHGPMDLISIKRVNRRQEFWTWRARESRRLTSAPRCPRRSYDRSWAIRSMQHVR